MWIPVSKSIGLNINKIDIVQYVTDNAKERNKWYREFIRAKLSEAAVMYDSDLKKLQNMLFSEQYPERYNEMTSKLTSSYAKKEENLNEKLKELVGEQ